MASQRAWLMTMLAFLLVSSIVGHYVSDVVCDAVAVCEGDSAETHPLHTSVMPTESTRIQQPISIAVEAHPMIHRYQSHTPSPQLRPPIAL